jgi:hypothetical protein
LGERREAGQDQLSDGYDRLSAARHDLDLLLGHLSCVSGQLEELGTMWRRRCRAENSWRDLPPGFPQGLRDATRRLASTVQALVEAGAGQAPDLAFSAVAQLSALDDDIAAAAAIATRGSAAKNAATGPADDAWASARTTLSHAGKRLWSLISHLVRVKQWSLSGHPAAGEVGLTPASIAVIFG